MMFLLHYFGVLLSIKKENNSFLFDALGFIRLLRASGRKYLAESASEIRDANF